MPSQRSSEEKRFQEYLEMLHAAVGHADRREPLRAYLSGLLLPGERKSVEPMAARLDPLRVQARHQSMLHFVGISPWSERDLLRVARDYALAQIERHAPVGAWVVGETGLPKQGAHLVGVARQPCGVLGKEAHCQVAVTVSLANALASVPCGFRLYLPEEWARDAVRRRAAGVPAEVGFQTRWEIALEQIDDLLRDDLPRAPVVADAGYGTVTAFRDGLVERGLAYAVEIPAEIRVWPLGEEPSPPAPWPGRGRPPRLSRRTAEPRPVSVAALARGLKPTAWKTVRWREGSKGTMSSRFAAVRARVARRDGGRREVREPEWLLFEWPATEKEPSRFWLSTLPAEVSLPDLVRLAKLRWRVERDFQELKDELGLDHYEGRGWRGFHHHGALCIAAYDFLAAERARLSPPAPVAFLRPARLPKGFRPRGSPQPGLHRRPAMA
jgi:SRSO17 transposase